MQKPGYYTSVNPELLASIPLTANSVLEIGCGAGALGHVYKKSNPLATYVGIEYVKQAAESASQVLNHVLCGDVEDPDLIIPTVNNKPYDCIVYGDVLEHLRDPWKCLSTHLDLLSNDGVVVACIPNVQHWSVLAHLLNGQWPTVDQGLFDRTHLRWFTRDSIVQWFKSAGLHIYDMQPRIFAQEKAKDFVQKMLPGLQNLGLDPKKVFEGMAPLQYVITAGRVHREPLLLEGLSTIRPDSMAEIRLAQPLRVLASQPCIETKLNMHQIKLSAPSASHQRVLIWQRPIFHPTEQDFEKLRTILRHGYVVVIDWDDDPDYFPILREEDYITFRMVHAIQTSRPELADIFRQWNPNVIAFPNMLEKVCFEHKQRGKSDDLGLKMFFGAFNREKDWMPLMGALNGVLRDDPNFWSVSVVHDHAFFEAIDLPPSQKSFLPHSSHIDYMEAMSSCDFAFLPLLDTRFNRLKSDLKAVEVASCGLAALASCVVYKESVQPGETGELFSSASEMVACLKAWHNNPQQVRILGSGGMKWVRERRMSAYQVNDREKWYRSLVDQRDQLTRELFERVPQLKHVSKG